MAKTSTISDAFPGSSFSATWNAYNSMTCSNEALATVSAAVTAYCVLQTATTYDATSSYALSWLTSAGDQTMTSLEVYALQLFLGGGANANSNVAFYLNQGTLRASYDTGAGLNTVASVAYDPALHRFFQISESGGTVTWATSADGQHFKTLGTAADPITLTAVTVQLVAGHYTTQATDTTVTWASAGLYGPAGPPRQKLQAVRRAAYF